MSKYYVELKWAAIFAVMTILWMVLEKMCGLHSVYVNKHPLFTNLFLIPAITVYVMAFYEKKARDFKGKMTFKAGFMFGMLMAVIVALFSPFVQYISLTVISPEFFPNMIRYAVEKNLMTQADAESYFNLKSYIIQGFFGTLVMGIVVSAITAYRMQNK